MALYQVTAPTTEPLTVAEVKAHLRLDNANGEPAPTGITVALASAGAGNVDNGAHRYLATFVTADGETDPGTVSAAVTVTDKTTNGKVSLSAIPVGGSAVTARKLYRTVAAGSTYLLLATLSDNATTTYTDNLADASLGAQAPVTNTTADPELVAWITAARQTCETITHRAIPPQTWDEKFDGFPWGPSADLWLSKPPVTGVTSVTYLDTQGATQTWTAGATGYLTDLPTGPWARRGRIYPAYGIVYPPTFPMPASVTVRFTAGYATVPAPMKAAMKLLIGNWWQNREAAAIVRASADVLPLGVDALLWPFKAF